MKKSQRGYRVGDPLRFVRGHNNRPLKASITPPNPTGLCMCGCGERAAISPKNNASFGHAAGHPVRFLPGHAGRLTIRDRIEPWMWDIEDRGFETPCRIIRVWKPDRSGHCRIQIRGKRVLAHRAMWEQEIGAIPRGLVLDHLCLQPPCINTTHLEPVTLAENSRRGGSARRSKH